MIRTPIACSDMVRTSLTFLTSVKSIPVVASILSVNRSLRTAKIAALGKLCKLQKYSERSKKRIDSSSEEKLYVQSSIFWIGQPKSEICKDIQLIFLASYIYVLDDKETTDFTCTLSCAGKQRKNICYVLLQLFLYDMDTLLEITTTYAQTFTVSMSCLDNEARLEFYMKYRASILIYHLTQVETRALIRSLN